MTPPRIPDEISVDLSRGISGVMLSYVTSYPKTDIKRSMSELLYRGLQGFCSELYALGVRTIIHQGIYNARSVRNGNDWSNHAYALAIDLYAFVFESGAVVPVSEWKQAHKVAVIERLWNENETGKGIAHRYFSEVITPETNKLHADHIHAGYSGKRYQQETAKWYRAWNAPVEPEHIEPDTYTSEEKAIAFAILKDRVWDEYAGTDGDPGTLVRNIITGLVKREFELE